MRFKILFLVIAVASAVAIGACSNVASPTTSPAAAGQPAVTLGFNPDPPVSNGETELQIDVKDSGGNPLTGVEVTVLADMVGHSMGVMQGQASEQGNGRYATYVPFNMAGPWKVTIEVSREGELLVRQDFSLNVQ